MAVAYFSQFPKTDPQVAERVMEHIMRNLGGRGPQGAIFHAEGPTDDGDWWGFDVWASEADYQNFNQQFLQPALAEANAPRGEVRQLQVRWDSSQMPGGAG